MIEYYNGLLKKLQSEGLIKNDLSFSQTGCQTIAWNLPNVRALFCNTPLGEIYFSNFITVFSGNFVLNRVGIPKKILRYLAIYYKKEIECLENE